MFYWAALPLHKNFNNNDMREKFNFLMEAGLKQIPTMRVAKIKEVWAYNGAHVVERSGRITSYGVAKYWQAIDAAIKFNIIKHEQFLRREKRSVYESLKEMTARHAGKRRNDQPDQAIIKHRKAQVGQDKFHWNRNVHTGKGKTTPQKKKSPRARRQINF